MPAQDLRRAPGADRLAGAGSHGRIALLLGPLVPAAITAWVLFRLLGWDGLSPPEWVLVALSVTLSAWVGFGFVSACAGFLMGVRPPVAPEGPAMGRTAVLLPAYNEDPGLILSAVQAIAEDIGRLGHSRQFDFFILSDTRDEEIARAEVVGALRLRQRLPGGPPVYYRRRRENTDRKAGNIADWVTTHGGDYAYMVVLDADSVMCGETLLTLTARMDAEPRLGLLQTVPTIVNAETPFARLQQFASRLYGPVFALGQQWWSRSEGNYWGHNAIIRVAAFASSAGLPHLPGRKPWGGHIMSHDFVEAALLRRAGWAVRTDATLGGSFEETPPTMLDSAQRDRRWCQGNLQHARLLTTAGLHWVSRLHLVMGIFAYLAPALWLALLLCGAVVWPNQTLPSGSGLDIVGAFALVLALLLAPKLLAVMLALSDRSARRGFGGTLRLFVGFALECVASLVMTPVMMAMQSVAVIEVLIGRDSGWKPQRREGAEISGREAWRAHRGHVALGVFGGLGAWFIGRYMLLWASPVFLSLTLSAFLSLHTSKPRKSGEPGAARLLSTPEELEAPWVLTRARELREQYAAEATLRRQIDLLFRRPSAVYEPKSQREPVAVQVAA